MVRNHMKRLATPKSWAVMRKERKFITRPKPGRGFDLAMPLNQVMKFLVNKGNTTKEVRYILNHEQVLVNGKQVYDHRLPVGFMDVISFPSIKEHYLISLTRKGILTAVDIDKKLSESRVVKVKNKTRTAGKYQINAYDGTNVLADKADVAVGDSIVIKNGKLSEHLSLEKNATIFLTGGSHLGLVGVVKEVVGNTIVFTSQDEELSTAKRHAFVISKDVAEVVR